MAVGDFAKEEFSKEELEALGEAEGKVDDSKTDEGSGKSPEELEAEAAAKVEADKAAADKAAQEASKTAIVEEPKELSTEEKVLADQEGVKLVTENGKQYLIDDEGAKIPVERWRKNFAKTHAEVDTAKKAAEETNRKLNLLKELGAEKFFDLYPDERPANYAPPVKTEAAAAVSDEDFNTMIVNGGKYNGWALGDVAKEDPLAASLMLNNYLESNRAVKEKESKRQADFQQNFEQERNQFCYNRAKELFNKSDNFTDAEKTQAVKVYEDLSKWMIANKKSHYNMEDAYALMNKDQIIASKIAEASKAAIDKMTKPGAKSIGSISSDGKETGFESYMTMTEDQLSDVIDKMTDKEFKAFLKDAPKELRDKHPGIF
jgi:hypothetical protein